MLVDVLRFLLSAKFGVTFFGLASLGAWSALVALSSGTLVPATAQFWFGAVAGSLLFPALTISIWSNHQEEQADAANFDPERQMAIKHAEIQSLLDRQVTVSEALGMFRGEVETPTYRFPPSREHLPFLQQFFDNNLAEGDELWIYDTGEDAWLNLCGCWGFAVLRDGQVKAFEEVEEN